MPIKTPTVAAPPVLPMGPKEVRAIRVRTGLAQSGFAGCLNVSHELVQAWESGRRVPRGAALRLLSIAQSHPELVFPAPAMNAVGPDGAPAAVRRSTPGSTPGVGNQGILAVTTAFDAMLCGLADQSVDFVVVGGVAAELQGAAGRTDDLDIVYDRLPENLDRLANFLKGVGSTLRGAPGRVPFAADPRTLAHTAVLALDTRFGALDLRQRIAGVGDFAASRALSRTHAVAGRPVRVLSLDGLIASKRASGRPRDRDEVAELESLRRHGQA